MFPTGQRHEIFLLLGLRAKLIDMIRAERIVRGYRNANRAIHARKPFAARRCSAGVQASSIRRKTASRLLGKRALKDRANDSPPCLRPPVSLMAPSAFGLRRAPAVAPGAVRSFPASCAGPPRIRPWLSRHRAQPRFLLEQRFSAGLIRTRTHSRHDLSLLWQAGLEGGTPSSSIALSSRPAWS